MSFIYVEIAPKTPPPTPTLYLPVAGKFTEYKLERRPYVPPMGFNPAMTYKS